jgi:HPt (histidine-containing phosphotransfer) domain-containing protein
VPATEALPDMPGVKVAASVRRIGGNVALYYSLLDKFRLNQPGTVSGIRESLASNDRQTAERLAHTLKGIAGTLGAESLQSLAEQLENNIKKESFGELDSLLTRVDREVMTLAAQIDLAIGARTS